METDFHAKWYTVIVTVYMSYPCANLYSGKSDIRTDVSTDNRSNCVSYTYSNVYGRVPYVKANVFPH